jgi:hypothetical protein
VDPAGPAGRIDCAAPRLRPHQRRPHRQRPRLTTPTSSATRRRRGCCRAPR